MKDYGVTLAVDMIRKLVSEGGVPGVHFCTLNLEKSVQRVLENLQWTGALAHPHNRLIAVGLFPPSSYISISTIFKGRA